MSDDDDDEDSTNKLLLTLSTTGVIHHVDELIDRSRSPVPHDHDNTENLHSPTVSSTSITTSSSTTSTNDASFIRTKSRRNNNTTSSIRRRTTTTPQVDIDAMDSVLLANLKRRHDVELHRIASLTGRARQSALTELLIHASAHVPRSTVDRRYYELIASEYAASATSIDGLEATLFALWSNDAFAPLFAATMFRWLFEQNAAQINRNFIIFLKGANRLFWGDLHGDTTHFAAVFRFVRDRVLLRPFRPSCRTASFAYFFADLFNLVARFHLFYLPNDDPRQLIAAMNAALPSLAPLASPSKSFGAVMRSASNDMIASLFNDQADGDNNGGVDSSDDGRKQHRLNTTEQTAADDASTIDWTANSERPQSAAHSAAPPNVGAEFDPEYDPTRVAVLLDAPLLSDMFVQSVVKALVAIRSEGALVAFLIRCRSLKDFDMTSATSLRLESAIYNYTMPGSPLYPPRSVRNAAQQTAQFLYPRGIVVRAVIFVFFRMLHPIYTTNSIAYWASEEWRQMRRLGPLKWFSNLVRVRVVPWWRRWTRSSATESDEQSVVE